MSAERHTPRHSAPQVVETQSGPATAPAPQSVAQVLASFVGTRVASLSGNRLPMPAAGFDVSGYDFPAENRDRDRAIFGAALKAATEITRGQVEGLDLLTEAADRVRWDRLCAMPNSKYEGDYMSHKTEAEIADRRRRRDSMLNDPANVEVFLPLVSAKIAEILGKKIERKARTVSAKSSSDAVDL